MIEPTLFSAVTTPAAVDTLKTGGVEFGVDERFGSCERIQLDEWSWVDHVHGWLTGDAALIDYLLNTADWEQRSRWMYTRQVQEPRLTAEYPSIESAGQPALSYITSALSDHYDRSFVRLWMNWYRDHNDGTAWHADRPANQRPEAVIPVLSLGATRRFLVRPTGGGTSRTFVVEGGDLIVMGGRTQRDYQHCVPKQAKPAGTRLSLNFSTISREPR